MKKSEVKDFNYDDCFKLGCLLVEKHDKQKEPIAIRIYMDDLVVFQYIMEGRDAGNIPWLERKANTVKKTGISSLAAYYAFKEGYYQELKEDESVALYGGGYPLYKDGKIICIICVSGMAHQEDAQLIEDTVEEYLNTK